MEVELSPYFVLRNVADPTASDAISRALELDWIDIELPGSREIQLHQKDFVKAKARRGNTFFFTFPDTEEKLAKLVLP